MTEIETYLLGLPNVTKQPGRHGPHEIPRVGRRHLVGWWHDWGFRRIVEIGIAEGLFTEAIARANPDADVIGVDSFQAYHDMSADTVQVNELIARQRLRVYPHVTITRGASTDVAQTFTEESIDAVYIDGDHEYSAVVADLHAWIPKVKRGGMVAGHDYIFMNPKDRSHVIQAINGYVDAYEISPWFVLGRKGPRSDNPDSLEEYRDHERSWCWIKH